VTRIGLDIIVETRGNIWKVERDTGTVYIWTSMESLGFGKTMGWQAGGLSPGEKKEAQGLAIAHYTRIVEDGDEEARLRAAL